MKKVRLREICHARSGDKGFHANIGLIVYDKRHFELIRQQVTAERVKVLFQDSVKGEVKRYELPRMGALNFVLYDSLDGGATRTLSMDSYGKVLSSVLLSLEVEIPEDCE
jgi:hypothetical protein